MFDDGCRNEYCGIRTNGVSEAQYELMLEYLNAPIIESISYYPSLFDKRIENYYYYISSDDTLGIIEDVLFKLFIENNNVSTAMLDRVYHNYSYTFVLIRDRNESLDEFVDFIHKYHEFRHEVMNNSLTPQEKAYRTRKFFVHIPNIDLDYRLHMLEKYRYMNNVKLVVYDTVVDQFYTYKK